MEVKAKGSPHAGLAPEQLRAVAELFGVLAEESRLRILQFLQRGPATVGEIVAGAELKQANASKQLGILYRAGVLSREQEGNAARYSIRMPLVFDLCGVVCDGLRTDAEARLRALGGGGEREVHRAARRTR